MAELLLELFSEEIPARMQKRAEEDLARLFKEAISAAHFGALSIQTFSTPRRLGLIVDDLPVEAQATHQTRKGPRVGAAKQAIDGFLKSTGLGSIDDAQIEGEVGKEFYVARIVREALPTTGILQTIVPEIIRAFPWPKSMRSQSSDLTWVRPLHNILCLFDGAPVKISVDTIASKPITLGHRFHAADEIKVTSASQYKQALAGAHVVLEREERKRIILEGAKKACEARGLSLVEDPGLLEEVAGLAEWPVVLLGDMDPAFLDLPAEVIRLSMRTHQKYFAVRAKDGKLAPHFVTVANVDAKDGGKAIAAGNARVLSARLNDARFFWDTDKKLPLGDASRVEKLKKIVFHQKLGSVWDKVERVKALAVELCAVTGADKALVERAAMLCKCDLVTETVGEFPELQGQIGRQLASLIRPTGEVTSKGASAVSEHDSVAIAIEDHYRPLGPNDRVPTDKVAVTLALADKLDTLVGFWAIDEKPTGSSDPYALRRAALGFVRTILDGGVRLKTADYLRRAHDMFVFQSAPEIWPFQLAEVPILTPAEDQKEYSPIREPADLIKLRHWEHPRPNAEEMNAAKNLHGARWSENGDHPNRHDLDLAIGFEWTVFCQAGVIRDLSAFLADRLKVQLRDQGKRHDLVDAVFALGDDDLVRIVARVEALNVFLKSQDGANLLAGYKRAANILAAEEKKGRWSAEEAKGAVDPSKLVEPAEKALAAALDAALPAARAGVEKEDFAAAMKALSGLRAPVDAFFESVLVNAPDEALRRNRLLLLSRLVEALSAVADFSKIEG
jgi:glycyl-tRNA synthetase beta chain